MRWALLGLTAAVHLRAGRQARAVAAALRSANDTTRWLPPAPPPAETLPEAVAVVNADAGRPAAGPYIPRPEPGEVLGKLPPVPAEDPVTSYRCLPFPHGCEHLMHMCAVTSYDHFGGNTTCLNWALDVTGGFIHCREASFAHGPDVELPEGERFGDCLAANLPATRCTDMCDDLLKADVALASRCQDHCRKMDGCFSSCGVELHDPDPVSNCVGECMGPVPWGPDGNADLNVLDCNTTQCEWLKMATGAWDHVDWHFRKATEDADHMKAATRTLYDLSKVGTTPTPLPPTPFPWGALKARLVDHGTDPFAAFIHPTALPEAAALAPLPWENGS